MMLEVGIVIVMVCILGIALLSVVLMCVKACHCIIENKRRKEEMRFYFGQELYDSHVPYNGPDFINRFETDPWELR